MPKREVRVPALEVAGNRTVASFQEGHPKEYVVHPEMPPLGDKPNYPRFKRHLPDRIFYAVPALMWLILSVRNLSLTLPTAANPVMEAGGLWGESKLQGLSLFGERARRSVAPYVSLLQGDGAGEIRRRKVLEVIRRQGLSYPLVVKPDRGYQGWGVKVVADEHELVGYLTGLPSGVALMLQEYVQQGGEAGIFYVRAPGESRGRIVSMALAYAPHVVGDGTATLGELVERDPVLRRSKDNYRIRHGEMWDRPLPADEVQTLTKTRSARLGAVYRDASHLVTPELERTIDEISQDIEGFSFGRFDIRFESLGHLRRGEGLRILELNGAGGEMLHIWDGSTRLREAYHALWWQYRTLFAIAAANVRRGCRPTGLYRMIKLQRRQEALRKAYPPSS